MAVPIKYAPLVDNALQEEPHPPNHHLGPWSYGGALYTVNKPYATLSKLVIYKSADGGYRWTVKDYANSPQISGTQEGVTSVQVGSILYVLATEYFAANMVIRPFNMATDTWGAAITTGLHVNADFFCYLDLSSVYVFCMDNLRSQYFLEARSDGSFVLMYHYEKTEQVPVFGGGTVHCSGLKAVVRSSAGVWGTPFNLGHSGTKFNQIVTTVKGSSDRLHIFFIDETLTLYHQTIDAANGLHTIQTVAPVYIRNQPFPPPQTRGFPQSEAVGTAAYNSVTGEIVVPYKNTLRHPAVAIGTDVDDPAWSLELVHPTLEVDQATDRLGESISRCRMVCVPVQGITNMIWSDFADHQTCWASKRTSPGVWTSPYMWYKSGPGLTARATPTELYMPASFSVVAHENLIRVLFMDAIRYWSSEWRYFEFIVGVGAVAAPATDNYGYAKV